ncbi:hypothetical protein FRACYDRAFT_267515, partial [Fragilariopsis cylindrus CCMP1102]
MIPVDNVDNVDNVDVDDDVEFGDVSLVAVVTVSSVSVSVEFVFVSVSAPVSVFLLSLLSLLSLVKKHERHDGHSFSRCSNNHCIIHSSWKTCEHLQVLLLLHGGELIRADADADADVDDAADDDHITVSPISKLSKHIGHTSSS